VTLSLRYSGGLEVRWRGALRELPERKDTLRLWLALLFREGRTINREALANALWPELAQEQRSARLRYHLHALKRYLPSRSSQESGWLLVTRGTLAWNPDAGIRSDLGTIRKGLRSLDVALEQQRDLESARMRAIELVGFDRGPFLPAWDESFLEAPRAEMDALQADVLDRLAELHRAVGRRDAAIERSLDLLRRRPGDERAHRRLMRIAAAEIDETELRARFEDARSEARNSEEAGLEEETEALLADLQRWLKRVEDAAAGGPGDPDGGSATRAADPPYSPTTLPDDRFAMAEDRIDELGRLESLRVLHAHERCVTLTGAGGSGKTHLLRALLISKDQSATIAIDLDEIVGSARLYVEFARLLEIPDGLVLGESLEAREILARTIGRRELDLILDHGEQHAAALAAILPELLGQCPGLRVVLASRETLRIDAESVWRMPLLTVPRHRSGRVAHGEAMALLERERRTLGHRLGLDERGAMARICIALDGLPVALISSAHALERWSPEALAEQIEQNAGFVLDCSLPKSSVFRYANLRVSFQTELQHRGRRERRLLRGLADLSGPFDLDQIRQVGEALEPQDSLPSGTTWVETLLLLRERSVIQVEVLPDGDYAYRLLQPLRAYVLGLPEGFDLHLHSPS
jgi:DNA-binding SARP family transcriptional activator/predicted ATPase